MANPSQVPVRYPSGMTTDQPWQCLANYGFRNPFMYHEWEDDFDGLPSATGVYTATKTNAGTIAATAGDGGLLLFTTDALATDTCAIQLPTASFVLNAGKKCFFLTRIKVSSAANTAFEAGLIQTTTTAFTVTDGVYFTKATGSASNLILRSTVGSANTDLTIPTAAYTLADNTFIDLGFYIDRNGQINAFVDSQLVGWIPQSGTGTTLPNRGPVGTFSPTLTTATLNLTLAVKSGTASAKTMTSDFVMVAQER